MAYLPTTVFILPQLHQDPNLLFPKAKGHNYLYLMTDLAYMPRMALEDLVDDVMNDREEMSDNE